MAFQAQHFDPLTFAQANPFLTGFGAGQQLVNQGLINQREQLANRIQQVAAQFAQPEAQQELLKNQLNNQILQPQAQYAPQMTLAELALKRAMPNYYNALAGQAGSNSALLAARTNLLRQETPFDIQKAQADVYSDPLLTRANQLAIAQQNGASNPYLQSTLGQLGFGQGQNQGQSPQPMIPFAPGMQPNTLNAPRVMTGSPEQNYLTWGSPLGPLLQMQLQAYGKGLETQQTAQASDYSKALDKANDSATLGNQIDKYIDQFQQGYNNTSLKGYGMGHLPAVSSESQEADNASQNIAATVAKMIAGGRVTNYEMQYINSLKPNRMMNPETAQITSDFLKQKSLRMQEEQQFLNSAKNQGIDVYTANSLWNQYNNQRPVYDFSQDTPNTQFQNTWKDFLNPQSISATQNGQKYIPIPNFDQPKEAKNWFKSLNPGDRAVLLRQQAGQ